VCTNFTPTQRAQWVKETLGVDLPSAYPEETFPGYLSPLVVKSRQSERVACGLARFGLIPAWAKDDKISRHTYNARSETAAEKPSYRTAWRQRQFGLVLVDNFYEPSYASDKAVKWQIERASGDPFGIELFHADGQCRRTSGDAAVSQARRRKAHPCGHSARVARRMAFSRYGPSCSADDVGAHAGFGRLHARSLMGGQRRRSIRTKLQCLTAIA
jgi:hypothetical protein